MLHKRTDTDHGATQIMFRREDYWPYMFGIFVFAGLGAVPLLWGPFIDLPYGRLVAGSLVGCFVFAYAHTRDGRFSFGRFIGVLAFVFLMSLKISARSTGGATFIPGGLLGFLVMGGCGWLGIFIARAFGVSQVLVTPDPTVLPSHDGSGISPGTETTRNSSAHPDTPYSFSDKDLRRLVKRTQAAWKTDALAHLSDNFTELAAGKSLAQFSALFKPALSALAFAFLRSPPDDDEFLLVASSAGVRLSFVLTNKYFYFFGLDQGLLASKYETGKVPLKNIASCTLTKGWVLSKATLLLTSGKSLHLKDLMSPAPVQYIMRMTQTAEVHSYV